MYHSIGNLDNNEVGAELYCVSIEKFREQMEYLSGRVPLQYIRVSPLRGQTLQIGKDSPCITFDDGLLDNYTSAYPILREFGLKAYFFILAGKLGMRRYMTWEQIKELSEAGMIIGSHGMTHRILTELSDRDLDYELKESKAILEKRLDRVIEYLSLPKGHYNQRVINKIKEAGYKAVFTSNPKDNDGFKFGRIPIKEKWNLGYFKQVVSGGLSLKDKMEELVKDSSKRILGARRYSRLREKLLEL